MKYEEEPDYDFLKGLFEECIRGIGETYDNIYDWSSNINLNTVISCGLRDVSRQENNWTLRARARATSSLSFGNNKTIVNNYLVNTSSIIKHNDSNHVSK